MPGPYLVVDLGGGSTELVRGTADVEAARSVDVGSVRMTERHLHCDPPTPEEVAAARRDVGRALDAVEETVDLTGIGAVVGLAGTITTITAHALALPEYLPDAITSRRCRWRHTRGVRVAAHHGARRAGRPALPAPGPGRRHRRWCAGLGAGLERALLRSPGALVVTSEHDILDGIALSLT